MADVVLAERWQNLFSKFGVECVMQKHGVVSNNKSMKTLLSLPHPPISDILVTILFVQYPNYNAHVISVLLEAACKYSLSIMVWCSVDPVRILTSKHIISLHIIIYRFAHITHELCCDVKDVGSRGSIYHDLRH